MPIEPDNRTLFTCTAEEVPALIAAGADVNGIAEHETDPLFYTSPETAEALIAGGKIIDVDVIGRFAFFSTDAAIASVLGEARPDVYPVKDKLLTPLFLAGIEKSKALLEAGADIEATSLIDQTALYFADADKTKLLLERGANVKAVDVLGQTALFGADSKKTQLLLEHGAEVGAVDAFRRTPLFYANAKKAELLLAAGAKVNHQDKKGQTILSYIVHGFCNHASGASQSYLLQRQTLIDALFRHGADPHMRPDEAGAETAAAMIEKHYKPLKKWFSSPEEDRDAEQRRVTALGALDTVASVYLWNKRGRAIEQQSITHGGPLGAATGLVASYCSDPASFRAIADALQIAQQREDSEKEAPSTGFRAKEDERGAAGKCSVCM